MKAGDSLRMFTYTVAFPCYILAIAIGLFDVKLIQTTFGYIHLSFWILSYGMSVSFLAIHFLIFAGKAEKSDLVFLGLYLTIYFFTSLAFVPITLQWIASYPVTLILLGVEYENPNWPVRTYKFVAKIFRKRESNKIHQK